MRIGIPRALSTWWHYPLWRRFITELGAEPVLSPATDRAILRAGVALAPAEGCLPLKAYLGHLAWLRAHCDAVLIHRVVCIRQSDKRRFGCPKAICLPDLARVAVPGLPPIFELLQDETKVPPRECYLRFGKHLNSDHRGELALDQAQQEQSRFEAALRNGRPRETVWQETAPARLSETGIPLGIVGHPYLIHDPLLSLNLLDHLRALGAAPRLVSNLAATPEFPEATRPWQVSWYYEQELLRAALAMVQPGTVAGLLLVSSFACGTAAVVNEVIAREIVRGRLPTMTLLLDEHTAESGIVTRLEAFLDLIRRSGSSTRTNDQ